MKWSDGSKFVGLWKHDRRHQGMMHMQDGTRYDGDFSSSDKYHGLGTLKMKVQGSQDALKIFKGYFEEG